jgi:KDO2-lipid IV(A) lauroyltransferase
MRTQDFFSSRPVTRLGIFIAQYVPRWIGYGLARIVADIIALRKPGIYWTVRANLHQILGSEVRDTELHQMARHVFFHAGQTYYDFFHVVGRPAEVLTQAVRLPESLIEQLEAGMRQGRGVLLLGTHMSNFDLIGLVLAAHGLPIQLLSLANPKAGFHILNQLRATGDFEVTPITPQSLRAAVQRLKGGGIVLTGIDRPVYQNRELIEFFGRLAFLPVGSARLALMTGATVLVGSCRYEPDEGYILETTGPIEMVRTGDRRQDILTNMRRLAAVVEKYVRAHPEQWMMFHPFWPESPDT